MGLWTRGLGSQAAWGVSTDLNWHVLVATWNMPIRDSAAGSATKQLDGGKQMAWPSLASAPPSVW